jgi:hypothetical protein
MRTKKLSGYYRGYGTISPYQEVDVSPAWLWVMIAMIILVWVLK